MPSPSKSERRRRLYLGISTRRSPIKNIKLSEITNVWIENLPKIINSNGCWILQGHGNGYTKIYLGGIGYLLHRLSMCIYNNIDYNNHKIECRHGSNCVRACFNYNHVIPGTASENTLDSVRDKTHPQAKREKCSKCNGEFKTRIIKSGWSRGQIKRYCSLCEVMRNNKL